MTTRAASVVHRRAWRALLGCVVAALSAVGPGCGLISGVDHFHVGSAADSTATDTGGGDGAEGEVTGMDGAGAEAGDGDGPVGPAPDAPQDDGPTRDASVPCPTGLQCDVACDGGTTTSISGTVYDPAHDNPLYNVAVYVPASPLQPLPKGVPTGPDACSCGALFKSGAVVSTATATDGSFTLGNVPVGSGVPLVIQVGKWRAVFHVSVTACQDNPQVDKSLAFPGSIPPGDTDDNLPDIAVSTGGADTLECLLLRMGISASEYVPGPGTGHVHVYAGGVADGGNVGSPEEPPMPGAPPSDSSLWATSAQLMPYDLVLLSCEGAETYDANPPALETYLNAGGRVLASHYQYAWFGGPIDSNQSYPQPADWSNLATWGDDQAQVDGPIGGVVDSTLNGSATPFAKGVALASWLANVGALGQDGVPSTELPIYAPRFNATVGPMNTPSQPWIFADLLDAGEAGVQGAPMTFSFDTPVTATPPPPGTNPYCGRAFFSDLHASGNPATSDTSPPPGGCDATALSPQEKALEFMLFDLSSCVLPDTTTPPGGGTLP
jgi:hypothetical protein